jgi:hypothetical protein
VHHPEKLEWINVTSERKWIIKKKRGTFIIDSLRIKKSIKGEWRVVKSVKSRNRGIKRKNNAKFIN